jgi:hypothetical protein
MTRLILFLVRVKLGVRRDEKFKFANQKAECYYEITHDGIWKIWNCEGGVCKRESRVSLNWLLDQECKVETYV